MRSFRVDFLNKYSSSVSLIVKASLNNLFPFKCRHLSSSSTGQCKESASNFTINSQWEWSQNERMYELKFSFQSLPIIFSFWCWLNTANIKHRIHGISMCACWIVSEVIYSVGLKEVGFKHLKGKLLKITSHLLTLKRDIQTRGYTSQDTFYKQSMFSHICHRYKLHSWRLPHLEFLVSYFDDIFPWKKFRQRTSVDGNFSAYISTNHPKWNTSCSYTLKAIKSKLGN